MTTAAAAELLCDIAERLAESRGRTIIAIDGRCAGGKTTLAHAAEELLLARGIPCRTLHTDDFFLRPEQRTEQRMKTAGGCLVVLCSSATSWGPCPPLTSCRCSAQGAPVG